MKRKIIKIDEEKCTGCGLCVPNCQEEAIKIIDGKAKLIGDVIYHKCIRCDLDARDIMRSGHETRFAKASYRS